MRTDDRQTTDRHTDKTAERIEWTAEDEIGKAGKAGKAGKDGALRTVNYEYDSGHA